MLIHRLKFMQAWAVVLVQVLRCTVAEGREGYHPQRVELRAVLVNCDKNPETEWGAATMSMFDKEELYRHNILKNCHKKIALTLRLQTEADGEANCNETLHTAAEPESVGNHEPGDEFIWVESAYDAPSGGEVPLLNPYVVVLRQEPVLQTYNLTFITTLDADQDTKEKMIPSSDEKNTEHLLSHSQQKTSGKRIKRTIILDGHDPRLSSFSVKIGQVKEDSVPVSSSTPHSVLTTENVNDCGLEVCTESENRKQEEKHHKPSHRPHSGPNILHHHTTTAHASTHSHEEKSHIHLPLLSHTHKHERSSVEEALTCKRENSNEFAKSIRIKRQHDSPAIVIGKRRSDNSTRSDFANTKVYDYDEPTYRDIKHETNHGKIEDTISGRDDEDSHVYDDASNHYEENKKKYGVYRIGSPSLWYSAKVQLFEKQAGPDGNTIWSDVTGGFPISVGSLQPETHDESASYVSVRYSAADYLRKEHLLLPASDSLMLLVPRAVTLHDKYRSDAGDLLVAPASAMVEPKGNFWMRNNKDGYSDDTFTSKKSSILSAARPLRSVFPGGAAPMHKLVHHHGETYLALRHPRAHRVQLDMEARADDNEVLTLETSARVSSIVVDSSRPERSLVYIQVANTGLLSALFRVVLTDCPPIMNDLVATLVPTPPMLVPPRHTRRVHMELLGPLPAEEARCSISMLNDKNEVAAIRDFTIRRNDRCFCIWHCQCTCIERSPHLPCLPLAPEYLTAMGLALSEAPRRTRAVCYSDSRALDALLLLVGLLLVLLLLGILKGLIGLSCTRIGVFGLERLVELPRPLDEYYEPWLRHRTVLYDCNGWPVHPDTKLRSVRVMSWTTEFCLNSVFFLTFPCALLWTLIWLIACRVCPCCAARCQPPNAPCYAWTQRVEVSNERRVFAPLTTETVRTMACIYGTDMDDTAEESDTNYVLDQMQKSRESLARTEQKRTHTSSQRSER